MIDLLETGRDVVAVEIVGVLHTGDDGQARRGVDTRYEGGTQSFSLERGEGETIEQPRFHGVDAAVVVIGVEIAHRGRQLAYLAHLGLEPFADHPSETAVLVL